MAHPANEEAHQQHQDEHRSSTSKGMYLWFGAMILTAMVVMYATMFTGTYEWSHVRLEREPHVHGPDHG
ncbi:hypothetical protein [Arthrobacter echini]|uniref:hypothetical protein n=1 Tax=Arthrobacter echini TaxID=1529066 RepID=UPI001FE5CC26|nr:hypothetical protein [Arthrobacter echini]